MHLAARGEFEALEDLLQRQVYQENRVLFQRGSGMEDPEAAGGGAK